jgi:threonine synthase
VNNKFYYQCTTCNKTWQQEQVLYLCPECSKKNNATSPPKGVLKVVYNYQPEEIPDTCSLSMPIMRFEELQMNQFVDLLPIIDVRNLPKLKVGNTPLYRYNEINGEKLPFDLYLKDDSQNPTYSFKDRASAIVSAYAKEKGFDTIVAASTGNAGSSLAGICASQGQKAIVMVPETAPLAKLTQIIMYDAKLIPVKGTYDDAFELSIKASEEFGWYNRNTAYNPLTIEGKKTVAFELFGQLDYQLPDRIFVPVGDGVIVSGVYKGFEDLLNLGIIEKIPTLVAVQSKGSNNLIRNIATADFEAIASNTIADSISVDIPRNFYMAKDFIKKYKGEILSVTDDEILNASRLLSKSTGLFAEPAAAAAYAGFLNYYKNGQLETGSKNVVLLTGSGLKDLKSVNEVIRMPESINPTIDSLANFVQLIED